MSFSHLFLTKWKHHQPEKHKAIKISMINVFTFLTQKQMSETYKKNNRTNAVEFSKAHTKCSSENQDILNNHTPEGERFYKRSKEITKVKGRRGILSYFS